MTEKTPRESGPPLLQRLRHRDRGALGDLARREGEALARAAFLLLGDPALAADASQDTLLAAWDSARRTTEETSLRPWLFSILYRICRKRIRSATRRRRRERLVAERRPEAVGDPDRVGSEDEARAVRRAVLTLPDELRAVIALRYEEGLTIAETARAMGIPEGTVKSRGHTALSRLKELLEGDG